MSRLGFASLLVGALLASTATAAAQGRHVFSVDVAQSAFTFSGTVQVPPLGPAPIQGNPSNTFNLAGTLDLNLTLGGGGVTMGQLVKGGAATTVPDLMGQVPGPFGPIATVDVKGLQVAFFSVDANGLPAAFPVTGGGAFSNVLAVAEILAGTADFNALGTPGTLDLTGQQSPPVAISGTIATTAGGFQLNVPLSLTFAFTDPGTGATGSLTLTGQLQADYRPLNSDVGSVSLATGGSQTLILSTGGSPAGIPYLVLASASGTAPGLPLGGGLVLPLNFDALLSLSLSGANQPPFLNTFGALDALGKATATIAVPAGLNPGLAGTQLNSAYVTINVSPLGVSFASNAEPLLLVP